VICSYLQQPVNKLLYWSPLEQVPATAAELGGEIDLAENLYKDLQMKYDKISNDS